MKFDKETLVIIGICLLVLIGWEPLCKRIGWIKETPVKETKQEQVAETKKIETNKTEVVKIEKDLPKVKINKGLSAKKFNNISLDNKNLTVKLNTLQSFVDKIVFKKFLTNNKKTEISLVNGEKIADNILNCNFSNIKETQITNCEKISENSYKITYELINSNNQKFFVTKTYTLTDGYVTKLDLVLINQSKEVIYVPTLDISAGELPGWNKLSGDKVRADKLKASYYNSDDGVTSSSADDDISFGDKSTASWSALSNKFFALILKSNQPFHPIVKYGEYKDSEDVFLNLHAQFSNIKIDANKEYSLNIEYYSGPKEPKPLANFSPECEELFHLAWGPLNYLAKWLLWFLIKFHAICGSYGWSIIFLTIIVRLIFWPITQKSNASMKKMQVVQPLIKEIREKYKDNPQLLNSKIMEVYQKEKINPLGGCLPILLQIPVFFALYATLDNALELRQIPFWWSPDLAGPDTIFSFPLGFSIFGISNFNLNPLVIIMTVLMVVQQKMTPTAMEPAQQKMMALMPIIMLIFLYELPSGLTLYWTVSQIFSILQLVIQKKSQNAKKVAN